MFRKGIKFSIQRVYFQQSYFESRHYGKRFNSIEKFKSLTFQLRAIYFHTFAVDMSVGRHHRCHIQIFLPGIQNIYYVPTNKQVVGILCFHDNILPSLTLLIYLQWHEEILEYSLLFQIR